MSKHQEKIKEILSHFEIKNSDLLDVPFTEINNSENNRKAYGIDWIMRGRADRKVRIVIDYDADFPKMILRIFPKDNHPEEAEQKVCSHPSK